MTVAIAQRGQSILVEFDDEVGGAAVIDPTTGSYGPRMSKDSILAWGYWLDEPDPELAAAAEAICREQALVAAPTLIPWDPEKHPRHPRGTTEGGEFRPINYYYGARLVDGGYQAFRIERGKTRYDFTREDVGPVRETYQEASAEADALFEAELEAERLANVRHEAELVAHVDDLRSRPGQGVNHTRTTTPVEGPDGELLTGTRDALQIQADEAGVPIEQYDAWTTERLQELTSEAAGARIAVRAPSDAVPMILNSGKIIPAFDDEHLRNDRTSSDGYMETRGGREMRLFGSHPVYGYVALDDEDMDRSIAKGFGDVKFTLRDDNRDRTTVTYSDSSYIGAGAKNSDAIPRKINEVDHRAVVSWMNLGGVEVPIAYKGEKPRPEPDIPEAKLAQWQQEESRSRMWGEGEYVAMKKREYLDEQGYQPWRHGDFIEAQIHGPVTLADVERIDFPVDKPPSKKTIARLAQLGIPWTIGGPDAP